MQPFDLIVFTCDEVRARQVLDAGAAAIMVDWENQNKATRQRGADTEINHDGPDELARVRAAVPRGHLCCRLNGWHTDSPGEIERALDCGANELFLPMVRSVSEVEDFLQRVNARADCSILIETVDAVSQAETLGRLPLRRIYVGLNDLSIDLGNTDIFAAVAEGLLDQIRPSVHTQFGFGGLTLPELGSPVPCRLLLNEIVRLDCSFTFLRRSFWRDTAAIGPAAAIPRILAAIEQSRHEIPARRTLATEEFRRAVAGNSRLAVAS